MAVSEYSYAGAREEHGPLESGYPLNAYAIARTPGGKIVTAGIVTVSAEDYDTRIAIGRRDATGAPDATFSPGGVKAMMEHRGEANDILKLHDGRYLVVGGYDEPVMRVWD